MDYWYEDIAWRDGEYVFRGDITDEMIERACVVLEDAGYEDKGAMDRPTVREALRAALDEPLTYTTELRTEQTPDPQ